MANSEKFPGLHYVERIHSLEIMVEKHEAEIKGWRYLRNNLLLAVTAASVIGLALTAIRFFGLVI